MVLGETGIKTDDYTVTNYKTHYRYCSTIIFLLSGCLGVTAIMALHLGRV